MMDAAVAFSDASVGRPSLDGPIAIISHSHPSVSKGGGEIAAYTVFRGMREIGVDAKFIATCSVADEAKLSLASRHEHAVVVNPEHYDHFYHLGSSRVTGELRRIFAQERIVLANFHHFFNIGLGALRSLRSDGPRMVLTLHEFLAICNHHGQMVTRPAQILCERASPAACATCFPEHTRQQFALRKRLFLDALLGCDAYVSPSQFLASRFVEWGLPAERMHVIENGLPHIPVMPVRAPKRDGDTWVIGFFGQINPFKGVDILLRAADLLKRQEGGGKIQFRIHGNLVGQGAAFTERFTKAVEEGGNVSWAGPYDNASVGRLMAACDYMVIPSRWWENSPVVIQEAYASGLPVICSGIGGMAEKIVDGVTGLHFHVNDASDLARVSLEAADSAVHSKLCGRIPATLGAAEMARLYISMFTNLERQSYPSESNEQSQNEVSYSIGRRETT